ncbi:MULTISPECIES: hypothetical protein [unclassified Streptomyces]|uniref:hypothetical protein n=1 Tax=unclassified Streptomyces TaxID=2593676 RepID=UPI0003674FE0|nr:MULTISPECIES: hypothetical protein [unclassified Streptomyces]MYY05521.1 hypothetical protein [Streptomyces sp. SID4913]
MSGRWPALLPAGGEQWPENDERPLVLVVSVVCDGRVSPVFVAHPEHAGGRDPFRGYVVEASDPLLRRPDVSGLVRAMHGGTVPGRGITASVLRLKGGELQGVRIARVREGALVLRAGELATGTDLDRARAVLAGGGVPDLAPRRRCAAGARLLYPARDIAPASVEFDVPALPAGVWGTEILARPGEPARPPAGSGAGDPLALGLAVGEDAAACRRALDPLPGALRVRARRS